MKACTRTHNGEKIGKNEPFPAEIRNMGFISIFNQAKVVPLIIGQISKLCGLASK